MVTDSTVRFSNRVSDYTKFRPDYPATAIDYLFENITLHAQSRIADVGSGTGILTSSLLKKGCSVVAVEPNGPMRAESDLRLGESVNYQSVAGSAEATTLENESVDLITAAQAFHWFDVDLTKAEFARILKPGGRIVLIWNRRVSSQEGFQMEYESLLNSLVPEYSKVSHSRSNDTVIEKFLGAGMQKVEFPNHQAFNFDGLKGRLQSSSYCPTSEQAGYAELMLAMSNLFDKFAEGGQVRFEYATQVYIGRYPAF